MYYDKLRNLPYASVHFIWSFLKKVFPDLEDKFIKQLKVCGLSARICYSNKTVRELLEKDEKLNDNEKLVKFLRNLYELGHTSVFAHNIVKIPITSYMIENYTFSIQDIANVIPEIFNFASYSYDYDIKFRSLPVILTLLETINPYGIKYYVEYNKMVLEKTDNSFRVIEKFEYNYSNLYEDNAYFFINLRAYLDIIRRLSDFDKSFEETFWNNVMKNKDKIENIEIVSDIPLETGGSIIFLNNIDVNKPVKGTIIFENVSRVLSHQLVRHVSFYYEQKSHRYVSATSDLDDDEVINANDVFVNPSFRYNDSENNVNIANEFNKIYIEQIKSYKKLINEYKVKKEDARYILGNGLRTTVVMSFTQYGLKNFFEQRADNPKAQWEIREVAKILKEFLGF